MPIAYSSVTCCEVHDSIKENHTGEERTADVTLQCAWADRYALVEDLLENNRRWPHGDLSGSKLVAKTASIKPEPTTYDTDGQACVYKSALIDVSYSDKLEEVTNEDDSDDPAYGDGSTSEGDGGGEHEEPVTDLMSEEIEPAAEFVTLDYRRFRWSAANGDPLLEGEAPGRLLLSAILNRTLYKVRNPPLSLITNMGKVNGSSYRSRLLGITFPKETLLFMAPMLSRTIRSNGESAWTVKLRFGIKPNSWNEYFRSKTGAFAKIYVAGGSEHKNYPLGNFSGLLF